MQGQRSPESERQRLHVFAGQALDADRDVVAPHAEEDRFLGQLVKTLHYWQGQLAFVEALHDPRPELEELEAEPEGPPAIPRLDELGRREARKQPIHARTWLAQELGQLRSGELAIGSEVVEGLRRLGHRLDRAVALARRPRRPHLPASRNLAASASIPLASSP